MLIDQIDFPRPVPVLELLFAADRRVHVAEDFEMNETVDFVPPGEPRQYVVAMLPEAGDEVGGYADIQRAVVFAREDIDAWDALLPHGPEFAAKWTLKQVQGDDEVLGLEAVPGTVRSAPSKEPRHAELVSASIEPQARRVAG